MKEERLYSLLQKIGKDGVTIAFSGGTDSAFLLFAATRVLPVEKINAVYVSSELTPSDEAEQAREFAQSLNVSFCIQRVSVLPAVRFNPKDRCYLCKKQLFSILTTFGQPVIDGTNADDLHTYRPGLRALKELGIRSVLAESGLTKAEIRDLAEKHGLKIARKPSSPCLATRLPYGDEITLEALEQIEASENLLKAAGFSAVRVRKHGNIARIEIPPEDFTRFLKQREKYINTLKNNGFTYVALDMEGLRSGSMDIN